jgi:hypothetical protein
MREHIRTVTLLGVEVEVSGFFDSDTPDGKYEGIDLFIEGDCANMGSALFAPPTDEEILPFVKAHLSQED